MPLTIYKSSAGSGKTYALVKEYLKIVLPRPEEFKSILAVTFTNKAAEEMRSRILLRLGQLAEGINPDLERQLREEDVEVNFKTHAKAVLDLILHNYSLFSVCTIDSFFHKIIRSFSKELKLRLGCGIEIEEEDVLEEAIAGMFGDIGEDKELTHYLQNFAFYSIDEESGWNIDKAIRDLGKEIFKERYRERRGTALADDRTRVSTIIDKLYKITNDPLRVKDNTEYHTAVELVKNIHTLGVFRDIQRKLVSYKKENNVVLISDINDLLHRIVKDNPSPFIYDRVGIKYRHFLIDEFQDTSRFQYFNLLPLIINSLSEDNSTVIVGDVKQSIFRWRNGEMKLLVEHIDNHLSHFKPFKEEKLTNNYRSRENIVSFNNAFFKLALEHIGKKLKDYDHDIIRLAYKEIEQTSLKTKPGGYVRIKFIEGESPPGRGARRAGWVSPEDKADTELLNIIYQVQSDRYPLSSITVLVRSNAHGIRVARLLAENEINVISAESLLADSSPQVKFLLSVLRWFVNRKNRLAKAEALYHYYAYLAPDLPARSAGGRDAKPERERRPASGGQRSNLSNDSDFFPDLEKDTILEQTLGHQIDMFDTNRLTNLPLYDLAETFAEKFGLNRKGNAYLLRFLDAVVEYSVKHHGGVSSFLEWWTENRDKYSIVIPPEEDAVRVLTIHKAKGLENQVVIIPYANWGMDSWRDLMWVNSDDTPFGGSSAYLVRAGKALNDTYFREQFASEKVQTFLDNLNLAYVALTRAMDRLYVIVPPKRGSYNIYNLLNDVISKSEEFSRHFVKAENVFEIGEPIVRNIENGKERNGFEKLELKNLISSDAAGKTLLKKSPILLKHFSKEKMDEDNIEGNVFHTAMSFIETADDIDTCLQKMIDKGYIAGTAVERLKNLIGEVVTNPDAAGWFGAGFTVRNEAELLLPDGTIIRPDRIVFTNSDAAIIDYKTGKEKPEHKEQLNSYSNALKSAGYSNIEKYIYYVKTLKIEKVA